MAQIIRNYKSISNILPCPHSHIVKNFDFDSVCINCGLIINSSSRISFSPQHNTNFANLSENSSNFNQNSWKKTVSLENKKNMKRMFKLERQKQWNDNRLIQAENEIKTYLSKQDYPRSIFGDCIYFVKKALNSQRFNNHRQGVLIRVVIYYILRNNNYPISIAELIQEDSDNTFCTNSLFLEYFQRAKIVLNWKYIPSNPNRFVLSTCQKMGLPNQIILRANKLTAIFQKYAKLQSYKENGIAGAAIFIAANQFGKNIQKKHLSSILNISTVTLRERTKDLNKILRSLNRGA